MSETLMDVTVIIKVSSRSTTRQKPKDNMGLRVMKL